MLHIFSPVQHTSETRESFALSEVETKRLSPGGNHRNIGQVQDQMQKVIIISQNVQPCQRTKTSNLLLCDLSRVPLGLPDLVSEKSALSPISPAR